MFEGGIKVNKNTRIKIASKLLTLAEELIKEAIDKRYQNPDGTFKVMTCPDNPKSKSKFCGCVRYQMAQGYSLERAKKICGKIKKMKYGGLGEEEETVEATAGERRKGRPRTNRERLKRHKTLHPKDEVEDIEDLPPRGTGLKRRSAVDPYVDIDHVTDTFLEWAGNPRKGANLTDELIDYFAKYKVKMEHRKPLINNLKGMGYKVDIDELKEREML